MRVPDTLDEATSPAWLAEVLGVQVAAVTIGAVDQRVSTNAPIAVDGADGSHRDLWIKGYFGDVGRMARPAGVSEALFYRDLAGTMDIRTLRAVHADVDLDSLANVVITEDELGGGARFLDALCDYSADQTAESLDQLAALHAATWMSPAARVPWLDPRFASYTAARGVVEIASNFDGPIGAGVPVEVRDAQGLYDTYLRVAAVATAASPWCVVHGDPHIGNVYITGDGRPSFLDWQLVQRGPWYIDVGYHIAAALPVAERRRSERDLLAHYLDRLRARGVKPPSGASVERGMRLGILHGFYLWGITQMVHPPVTTAMLERMGAAAADHDAFSAVQS
jgi:hypothetical protein